MGWNGSGQASQNTTPKSKPHHKWPRLVVLALCITIVGVIAWLLRQPTPKVISPDEPVKVRAHHSTRELMAAVVRPTVTNLCVDEVRTNRDWIIQIGNKEYNLTQIKQTDLARYHALTAEHSRIESEKEKNRRNPIQGLAEQLLIGSMPIDKGDAMPPLPINEDEIKDLEEKAEEMLAKVDKVEQHDTDLSIDIKNQLIEIKEEFRAAKAQGVSFYDFIRKRQERAQDDAAHLQDAIRLNEETYNDETVSDKDYEATRKKIDNLLKLEGYKGLPPLTEEQVQSPEEHAERQTEEAK